MEKTRDECDVHPNLRNQWTSQNSFNKSRTPHGRSVCDVAEKCLKLLQRIKSWSSSTSVALNYWTVTSRKIDGTDYVNQCLHCSYCYSTVPRTSPSVWNPKDRQSYWKTSSCLDLNESHILTGCFSDIVSWLVSGRNLVRYSFEAPTVVTEVLLGFLSHFRGKPRLHIET
jgi:hypothetical protein